MVISNIFRSKYEKHTPEISCCCLKIVSGIRPMSRGPVKWFELCPQFEKGHGIGFGVLEAGPAHQLHIMVLFREMPPMCYACTQLEEVERAAKHVMYSTLSQLFPTKNKMSEAEIASERPEMTRKTILGSAMTNCFPFSEGKPEKSLNCRKPREKVF